MLLIRRIICRRLRDCFLNNFRPRTRIRYNVIHVVLFPVKYRNFPIKQTRRSITRMIRRIEFAFTTFIRRGVIRNGCLTFPICINACISTFPLGIRHNLRAIFQAVFRMLTIVTFLLRLGQINVNILRNVTFLMINVPQFNVCVSRIVRRLNIFIRNMRTINTSFRSVGLYFKRIIRLYPSTRALTILRRLCNIYGTICRTRIHVIR